MSRFTKEQLEFLQEVIELGKGEERQDRLEGRNNG
jgi:hypothetical protein